MAEDEIQPGKITRVVRVRFVADTTSDATNGDAANGDAMNSDAMNSDAMNLVGCDGYGILQDNHGRDIFFVDSALQDARLTELEVGQQVGYVIDSGPLSWAAKVWVAPKRVVNACRAVPS